MPLLLSRPSPLFSRTRRNRAALWLGTFCLLLLLAPLGAVAGGATSEGLRPTPELAGAPAAAQKSDDSDSWERSVLGTLDRIDPTADTRLGKALTPTQQLLLALLLAAATLVSEDLTCVAAGLLASHGKISLGLAIAACLVGIFVGDLLLVLVGRWLGRGILERAPLSWILPPHAVERSERWFTTQGTKVVLASRFVPGSRLPLFLAAGILRAPFLRVAVALFLAGVVWTPLLVGLSAWAGGAVLAHFRSYERVALPAIAAALAATWLFARVVVPLFSWRGRRLLLSRWRRLTRWEFWPSWLFQLPVVGHACWLALRHRHPTLFTAANPGIPSGGFVEESKSAILEGLAGGPIARFVAIDLPEDPDARAGAVAAAMDAAGLALPIVLKPDVGERGRGVEVVRTRAAIAQYVAGQGGRILAQEYVPGEEFGVFYVRQPEAERGRIFSITGKRFPVVVGDGVRPLEELILADDRAVCMAAFYLDVNAHRLDDVPAAGCSVQLVEIGNHCRGTVFLDARPLWTPELEAAIEAIARRFEGFFFGRFDLRAPSVEAFRAGVGLKVLELNGVTSEATHIYDPDARLVAAYRTLFEQWRLAFEIGAANVARGARATGAGELFRLLRARRARFATIARAASTEPTERSSSGEKR